VHRWCTINGAGTEQEDQQPNAGVTGGESIYRLDIRRVELIRVVSNRESSQDKKMRYRRRGRVTDGKESSPA